MLINKLPKEEVITECSIQTSDGVEVADVAWLSEGFVLDFGFITPYPKAPELCIEIVSPSNSKVDIYTNIGEIEKLLAKQGKELIFLLFY